VVRFIEDNWLHGQRLGGGSFDATAGSIMDMFDFRSGGHTPPVFLDPRTTLRCRRRERFRARPVTVRSRPTRRSIAPRDARYRR
jgi:hypothetical protein